MRGRKNRPQRRRDDVVVVESVRGQSRFVGEPVLVARVQTHAAGARGGQRTRRGRQRCSGAAASASAVCHDGMKERPRSLGNVK